LGKLCSIVMRPSSWMTGGWKLNSAIGTFRGNGLVVGIAVAVSVVIVGGAEGGGGVQFDPARRELLNRVRETSR
jgi:hypothetical protein